MPEEERGKRFYHYTTLPTLEEIATSGELKPAWFTLAPNFDQTRTGLPAERMEVAIVLEDAPGLSLTQDPEREEWYFAGSTVSFGEDVIKIILPWQQMERIEKGYITIAGLIDESKRRRAWREALEQLFDEWDTRYPIKEKSPCRASK